MKKVFIFLGIIVCAFICTSCATLPKTIKSGDTLVIGQIRCNLSGYKNTGDINLNQIYTSGIEMKVTDIITNKEYNVHPDNDGYFYIKNLPAHHSLAISYVKVSNINNDGEGYSVSVTIQPNQRKVFIPYEKQVVNIGQNEFYFNGARNSCTWEYINYSAVNVHFKQLNEDSEWLNARIYDQ